MLEAPDKKTCTCWYCDGELELIEDLRVNNTTLEDDPALIIKCKDCGADLWIYEPYEIDEDGGEREIEMDLETEDAPYDRNRCPLCGGYAVWGSDFNYDEVFGEGQGIATYMSCMRCHATFQYSIRDDDPDCDSDPIPAEAI
jgi:hypothetical protein